MCFFGDRDSWRKEAGTELPDESIIVSAHDGRSLSDQDWGSSLCQVEGASFLVAVGEAQSLASYQPMFSALELAMTASQMES